MSSATGKEGEYGPFNMGDGRNKRSVGEQECQTRKSGHRTGNATRKGKQRKEIG